MPKSSDDAQFMARAIELSKQGFPAPNPRVGCVVARDGEIVAEGFHAFAGGPHAESVALNLAGRRAEGSTVYATLEPCNHHGRTPPCSAALIEARVARVVYAVADPNPKAQGGAAALRGAGIECKSGVLAQDAEAANRRWLAAMRWQRPFTVAKAAISLDGRIATAAGESKWITGEEARRRGRLLRAELGAVLVGRGTVEADDPRLTVREPILERQPVRVVLDPQMRLTGLESAFHGENGAIWVVAEPCDDPRTLAVPMQGDSFDLNALIQSLWRKGVTGCLVEGGARTMQGFFDAGLIDEIQLFVAPIVLGSGPVWTGQSFERGLSEASRFVFAGSEPVGQDLRLELHRVGPPSK